MMNNKVLTTDQYQDFLNDGYLVLRDFISNEVCENLMNRGKWLIEQFDPDTVKTVFSTKNQNHAKHLYFLDSGNKIHFFFEENAFDQHGNLRYEKSKSINKFGHAMHELDPVFKTFSRGNNIAGLMHDLGLNNPCFLQSMYICKQPRIGGEVNCHQDATYLYTEKQPMIGLWFALEDATIENGCLWAIPGGHKNGLKSRFTRNKDNTTKTDIFDRTPWSLDKMVPLEVPRGSVIALHGYVPHMSKANTSDFSRHAYTLHFMSGDNTFAADNWLQRPANLPWMGFSD